jgi:hypothetical protein
MALEKNVRHKSDLERKPSEDGLWTLSLVSHNKCGKSLSWLKHAANTTVNFTGIVVLLVSPHTDLNDLNDLNIYPAKKSDAFAYVAPLCDTNNEQSLYSDA